MEKHAKHGRKFSARAGLPLADIGGSSKRPFPASSNAGRLEKNGDHVRRGVIGSDLWNAFNDNVVRLDIKRALRLPAFGVKTICIPFQMYMAHLSKQMATSHRITFYFFGIVNSIMSSGLRNSTVSSKWDCKLQNGVVAYNPLTARCICIKNSKALHGDSVQKSFDLLERTSSNPLLSDSCKACNAFNSLTVI